MGYHEGHSMYSTLTPTFKHAYLSKWKMYFNTHGKSPIKYWGNDFEIYIEIIYSNIDIKSIQAFT